MTKESLAVVLKAKFKLEINSAMGGQPEFTFYSFKIVKCMTTSFLIWLLWRCS